jgi:hypothetical protein
MSEVDHHESATESRDPWIDAYLAFRAAVLNDRLTSLEDAEEYARELKRHLPAGQPSITAAMFISADIAITFPDQEIPHHLVRKLWTPGFPPHLAVNIPVMCCSGDRALGVRLPDDSSDHPDAHLDLDRVAAKVHGLHRDIDHIGGSGVHLGRQGSEDPAEPGNTG